MLAVAFNIDAELRAPHSPHNVEFGLVIPTPRVPLARTVTPLTAVE
jgi:hypothetical protein